MTCACIYKFAALLFVIFSEAENIYNIIYILYYSSLFKPINLYYGFKQTTHSTITTASVSPGSNIISVIGGNNEKLYFYIIITATMFFLNATSYIYTG